MAIIFSVFNDNGFVGRCDGRCHEAEGPECNCVCGGAFHGVGSKIAVKDRCTLTEAEICEGVGMALKPWVVRIPEESFLFDM